MKYLLMICIDKPVSDEPIIAKPMGVAPPEIDIDAWVDEMDGRGVRSFGERLRPASDATTVRVRNDEILLSDGPYAETKEQIAGIDVIDCADLDEALEIASKHPMARGGMVEVRPFWTD
jgi:hypothetical protein